MENNTNDKRLPEKSGPDQSVIHPDDAEQSHPVGLNYDKEMKEVNSKIMKLTMTIMNHYPELNKYLEEMPVTIPNENDPEMTLHHIKAYYESLNLLVNKYQLEHPSDGSK